MANWWKTSFLYVFVTLNHQITKRLLKKDSLFFNFKEIITSYAFEHANCISKVEGFCSMPKTGTV